MEKHASAPRTSLPFVFFRSWLELSHHIGFVLLLLSDLVLSVGVTSSKIPKSPPCWPWLLTSSGLHVQMVVVGQWTQQASAVVERIWRKCMRMKGNSRVWCMSQGYLLVLTRVWVLRVLCGALNFGCAWIVSAFICGHYQLMMCDKNVYNLYTGKDTKRVFF